MTTDLREYKIYALENRINSLSSNGKNEGMGVIRKLKRQLRNLQKES